MAFAPLEYQNYKLRRNTELSYQHEPGASTDKKLVTRAVRLILSHGIMVSCMGMGFEI